jgi:hypothetical protein
MGGTFNPAKREALKNGVGAQKTSLSALKTKTSKPNFRNAGATKNNAAVLQANRAAERKGDARKNVKIEIEQ